MLGRLLLVVGAMAMGYLAILTWALLRVAAKADERSRRLSDALGVSR